MRGEVSYNSQLTLKICSRVLSIVDVDAMLQQTEMTIEDAFRVSDFNPHKDLSVCYQREM